MKRFDPDCSIAQSWQRLANIPNKIQQHDIILLYHELLEMNYVLQGYNQKEAHFEACKEYNYPYECVCYYKSLRR